MRPRSGARWSNSQASRWFEVFVMQGPKVPKQSTILPRRHSGARVKRANPESMEPRECREEWIPGLRLKAHPGMTKSELDRNDAAQTHLPFPRRDSRPSHAHFALEMREGAGNAGCFGHTRSLVCETKKHTSKVTTGIAGSTGIPCASGFNGFLRALPGDRAFLSPSPADHLCRLDISVEMPGPHDFAVRPALFV